MDRDVGFLIEILIAARDVLEFKQKTTKEEFLSSRLLRSAIGKPYMPFQGQHIWCSGTGWRWNGMPSTAKRTGGHLPALVKTLLARKFSST